MKRKKTSDIGYRDYMEAVGYLSKIGKYRSYMDAKFGIPFPHGLRERQVLEVINDVRNIRKGNDINLDF